MTKSILISIKPRYVADILNHKKTIEVRKSMPKCDLPIDVYIYCTKNSKQELCYVPATETFYCYPKDNIVAKQCDRMGLSFNGKVVAKFTLNKVNRYVNGCNVAKKYPTFNDFEKILTPACIYTDELENYCEDLSFYAWHISNLEIFDRPKELSEFGQCGYEWFMPMEHAPQSWQFIEVEE